MRSTQKTMALWALLVVLAIVLYQIYDQRLQNTITDFNFTKFMTAVEAKEIKADSVTINEDTKEYTGEIKPEFKDKYSAVHFRIIGNTGDETPIRRTAVCAADVFA